jgi:molybdopterin/thiamine biosynthesis adenylyltransferase
MKKATETSRRTAGFVRGRYDRQIAMPEIGKAGQKKLGNASVLIVGVGGLGSVSGYYLAGAGVGTLGLVDGDRVEVSNLHRQIAHSSADMGRLKVESAAEKFTALNPDVKVVLYARRFELAWATKVLADYDFVIDATDNFVSKLAIARACHAARKPYSHAGIRGFRGQAMTVLPGKTCCYCCVFGDVEGEESGSGVGPLGPVPGVLGAIQACEAIKHIVGCGELLTDRLLAFDGLRMETRVVQVKRNELCSLCGHHR